MIKNNKFSKLFPRGTKLPLVDIIRDTFKVIDIKGLKEINEYIIRKAVENKVFKNGTIDGYTMTAIDGTKFFESNKKSCPECLRNKAHCFHIRVVMSIVRDGSRLVIYFENYRPGQDSESKGEGEQSVVKGLLTHVVTVHKRLIDVVDYDALAWNSVLINHCMEHRVDAIVRTKNNNNKSIKDIKRKVNKSEIVEVWIDEKGFEKIEAYESLFTMDKAFKDPAKGSIIKQFLR